MKLIIGLGNPGREYERTRRNVGFMVVDGLAQNAKRKTQNNNLKFKIEKRFQSEVLHLGDLLLVKPLTFMNRSGEAVKKLTTRYKLPATSLYVIHDDLDIPLGKYKIQKGRGPKEHRGVTSVEMALGSKDFWRVRIGVDNRPMANGKWQMASGDEYVLSNFPKEEKKVIDRVINKITLDLVRLLDKKTENLTN